MSNKQLDSNVALAAATLADTRRPDANISRRNEVQIRNGLGKAKAIESVSYGRGPTRGVELPSLQSTNSKAPVSYSRGRSPSHIAAKLAVSRSTSSEIPTLSSFGLRKPSPLRDVGKHDKLDSEKADQTPIETMDALVQLFESKKASISAANDPKPMQVVKRPSEIANPVPIRPQLALRGTYENKSSTARTWSKTVNPSRHPGAEAAALAAAKMISPAKPSKPLPTSISYKVTSDQSPFQSQVALLVSRPNSVSGTKSSRPISHASTDGHNEAPSRGNVVPSIRSMDDICEPNVKAYETAAPRTQVLHRLSRSEWQDSVAASPAKVSPGAEEGAPAETNPFPGRITPQVNDLANAIVASSLASSRAPSPTKPGPPLPSRPSKQFSLFKDSRSRGYLSSRTPSPQKGMRRTMRGPPKSEEEDHKKGNGHLVKKHPNKHHEGERKRWRDQITERERKRYEGVWAANRGLHLADHPEAVADIVVRDIWTRSRLPEHLLEEIWNCVDRNSVRKLAREEFVVGMWLIDQYLKGRKIPQTVSESVWSSVRRLEGINVSGNRH